MIVETDEAMVNVRCGGAGPAVLLLHGFPETLLMWRDIAPLLAAQFTVVCADLRGYGNSSCPPSTADHAPYSKRVMARDMVAVMARLGHDRFAVAGAPDRFGPRCRDRKRAQQRMGYARRHLHRHGPFRLPRRPHRR